MQLNASPTDNAIDLELPGAAPGVSPAGSPPAPGATGFLSQLPGLLTTGIQAYSQLQLQNLQMNLIRQGKPPLTQAQLAQLGARVNVGLAPDVQTLLMYGGAAVVGMFLLSQLGKRRKG